ncbi:MAG: amidase [Proteobacteria bacterium]|nr:amidase [Pseudomonadota bacterium]
MSDLAWLSVREASKLIGAGKLSPVELTKALLARIEKIDGRWHAFIRVLPERALAAAKAAEMEIGAGHVRGPFHGIPVGLKDIIDLAGVPTTCHSKVFEKHIAKSSAVVTEKLEAAGAVIVGKLATHEFAIGGPSFDLPWPPAVNPWGGKHFPGGSSSGSGVALASGMLPAALGTDTGGSVRNPASMCAIVGMKPTYGRVSRRGVFPLSFSLDHVGPMTRDVADNAALLQVLAGHDPLDPGSADVAVPDYSAEIEKGVKGLRIGLVRHFYDGDETASAEQIKAIDAVADVLKRLGADVREIRLPSLADYSVCCRTILQSEAFAIYRKDLGERPELYGALARQRLSSGAGLSAADYVDGMRMRGRLVRQTLEAMAGYDAIITASNFDPPPPIDDAEACLRVYPRQARQPFNVTGQPALAMPAGFTPEGLPLSVQIVGQPWGEARVYRIAKAYEQAAGWVGRRPPAVTTDA